MLKLSYWFGHTDFIEKRDSLSTVLFDTEDQEKCKEQDTVLSYLVLYIVFVFKNIVIFLKT